MKKSITIKKNFDFIDMIINDLDKYVTLMDYVENIEEIHKETSSLFVKTIRKIKTKDFLPEFILNLIPKHYNFIQEFIETAKWEFGSIIVCTFEICSEYNKIYKVLGEIEFDEIDNNGVGGGNVDVTVDMNVEVLITFPFKSKIEKQIENFLIDKYINTLKRMENV